MHKLNIYIKIYIPMKLNAHKRVILDANVF